MAESRIPPPSTEGPSPRGEEETERLRRGLAVDSETREHARRQGLLNVLYWMAVTGIIVGGAALISGAVILMYHYLSPAEHHWLSDQQLRDLRTIATSGLGTAVLVELVRRYVPRNSREG